MAKFTVPLHSKAQRNKGTKEQRNKAYDYLYGTISDSLFGTLFGFNRDKLKAYMWMNLAIYNGSHFSQTDKKAFTYDMTQAQTSKAQDISSRCFASN